MNDQNKPVSSVEATANPIPSPGRRRLVKGIVMATPAVMTISHNVFAQAISSLITNRDVAVSKLCAGSFVIRDALGNPTGIDETVLSYSSFIGRGWSVSPSECGVPTEEAVDNSESTQP